MFILQRMIQLGRMGGLVASCLLHRHCLWDLRILSSLNLVATIELKMLEVVQDLYTTNHFQILCKVYRSKM
jgi:hypothetical protein